MKKIVFTVISLIFWLAILVVGLLSGFDLDELQLETLKLVSIVALIFVALIFIVGEISRNNSQMDKLWSILPIIYLWIVAVKGDMKPRLIIMAVAGTIWGARLTYNFAKKGAYSIKFWAGEEDYRWKILRENKILKNKVVWCIFDLLFISFFQSLVVLAITFPAIAVMNVEKFGFFDVIVGVLMLSFIAYETIADKQQMKFQTTKWNMINSGMKLEDLPEPYNKGFNTQGLWGVSRHPNYFAEQSIWVCLYLFCITSGVTKYGIFNWSILGCVLLILVFLGSSQLGEGISSSKYPLYEDYIENTSKYLPIKKLFK